MDVLGTMLAAALLAAGAPGGSLIRSGEAFLRPLQQRDSVLIADQLSYGFRLEDVPEGTALFMPEWPDSLLKPLEVVRGWQLDTVKSLRRASGILEGSLVVTTFDEGLYELPPIAVLRRTPDGVLDTLLFEPLSVEVKTMPVDTASFVPNDIKGLVRYPLTFREVLPYLAGGLSVAALAALLVWYLRRLRGRAAGVSGPPEPAHITALRKLDRYRGEQYWEPGRQKQFYSGITDTLREYIASRYGFGAMEMTTAEIFECLKGEELPGELSREMEELFRRADFVKFAKYVADREECVSALPVAVRFVTSTYQDDIEQQGQDAVDGEEG